VMARAAKVSRHLPLGIPFWPQGRENTRVWSSRTGACRKTSPLWRFFTNSALPRGSAIGKPRSQDSAAQAAFLLDAMVAPASALRVSGLSSTPRKWVSGGAPILPCIHKRAAARNPWRVDLRLDPFISRNAASQGDMVRLDRAGARRGWSSVSLPRQPREMGHAEGCPSRRNKRAAARLL